MADKTDLGTLFIRLQVLIGDLKKGLTDAQNMIKGTAEEAKKQSSSVDNTLAGIKTSYLAAAAGIYAAYASIKKAFDFAELGGRAEAINESFRLITERMGVDGENLISQIKDITKSYVDSTDIMVSANKLLAEGIRAQDIPRLFEAARIAARLMGTTVDEAMGLVTRAVLTFMVRGQFKQAFPMETEKVFERYAETLKIDADMLSTFGKQQAIVNEILRQAAEKMYVLGEGALPNAYENTQLLSSAWKEAKEVFGTIIVKAIMGVADVIGLLIDKLVAGKDAVVGFFEKVKEYATSLGLIKGPEQKPIGPTEDAVSHAKEIEDQIASVHWTAEKEKNDKDQIERQKLEKTLTKLRLDAVKTRVDAEGKISMNALEAQHAVEMAEAKRTNDDLFVIEQEHEKRKAKMELDNTLASLKAQENAEAAAAKADKKTIEIPFIHLKYRQQELLAESDYQNKLTQIDAKGLAERTEAYRKAVQEMEGITPELEPFAPGGKGKEREIGEMDARSRSLQLKQEEFDITKQIAEVDLQERTYQITKEEALTKQIDLQKQILGVFERELEDLNIGSEGYMDLQQKISDTRIKINELTASLEEQTGSLIQLVDLGLRKYKESLRTDLVTSIENTVPKTIDDIGNSVKTLVNDLIDHTKSLSQALQDVFKNLGKEVINTLLDIVLKAGKQQLTNLFSNLFPSKPKTTEMDKGATQAAGQQALNLSLTEQLAIIGSLTAAYTSLAAAKSAAGIGESGGGGGGTGLGLISFFGDMVTGYKEGGIVKGFRPISFLQEGALINRPTLAVVGETGQGGAPVEAVVPLKGGKIPVEGVGGGRGGGEGGVFVYQNIVIPDPQQFQTTYGPIVRRISEQTLADIKRFNKVLGR